MTSFQVGQFRVSADANNWTLERESVIEKGKNAGQTQYVLVGYYGRLEQALARMVDEHAKHCGATTLEELLTELRWFREQARLASAGEARAA